MYTCNSLSCGRSKRKGKEISGGREARGEERVIPRAFPRVNIPAFPFPCLTSATQSTSNRQGYLPFLLLVFGISGGRKAREEERVIPRAFPRVNIPAFPFPCLTSATQSTSNRQGYLPFLLLVFSQRP